MEHFNRVLYETDEIAFSTSFHPLAVCAGLDSPHHCRYLLAPSTLVVRICFVSLSAGSRHCQCQARPTKTSELLLPSLELHHPALQLRMGLAGGITIIAFRKTIICVFLVIFHTKEDVYMSVRTFLTSQTRCSSSGSWSYICSVRSVYEIIFVSCVVFFLFLQFEKMDNYDERY